MDWMQSDNNKKGHRHSRRLFVMGLDPRKPVTQFLNPQQIMDAVEYYMSIDPIMNWKWGTGDLTDRETMNEQYIRVTPFFVVQAF